MSRQSRPAIAAVFYCLLCASNHARATTRFVKEGATGGGASWGDASGDLQAMITASSSNDEVWVAAGTYKPGTARTDTFSLKSGVQVFGGFAGTETMLGQRDVEGNLTILSGEIGDTQDPTDNSYHVVTANAVSAQPETRLDGFTIRDGVASSSQFGNFQGAGIYIIGNLSSPRIAQCRIEGNDATASPSGFGAGVAVDAFNGQPIFENCLFRNNLARVRAGGLYSEDTALLRIEDCRFENNSTTSSSGGNLGGGALHVGPNNDDVRITNCEFLSNVTVGTTGGGGIMARSSTTLRGCLFDRNTASNAAGGAYIAESGITSTIVDCTFSNNECSASAARWRWMPGASTSSTPGF
jgi:parallel beta-helix repeat protein